MPKPTPLIRVSTRGAAATARALRGGKRILADELNAEIRELAEFSEVALKEHAPRDTNQGANSVRVVLFFRTARPQARIEADFSRDGFNYLESTRFGQKTDPIFPRGPYPLHVRLHGRDAPGIDMGKVRAYRPTSDWVEDAAADIDIEVDRSSRTLGRRFERRILS